MLWTNIFLKIFFLEFRAFSFETQPPFLSQTCTINNGSGIVNNASVFSVMVSCMTPPPHSVTVVQSSSVGEFAYVANTGSNNISAYTIDSSTGALTEISGSSESPFSAGTNPSSVTIVQLPGGEFAAYAANYNSANISVYTIDQITTSGALINPATVPAGKNPY
jgi:hypothetical protein